MAGDKIDYHSQGAKTPSLEVPPDLTQLSRDPRYQVPTNGSVSATAFQAGAAAAAATAPQVLGVAPQTIGGSTIERSGDDRWLKTSLPPDQLWPQLEAFWKEHGFVLAKDEPTTGVMETDWAENRAKLPGDIIRNTVGKVFDSAYSTGERDKFRTRVERDGTGSDVYISHRGMVETYIGERKEETIWQPRPADPQLEAEFLSRLMIKLGTGAEVAKASIDAKPAPGVVRARMLSGQPGPTLQVDDNFDRAWRRVGLALDRSGFTVEDRDRAQGIYFVRYVDPRQAGKDEPGLLTKMFNWFGSKKSDDGGVAKYRVVVKASGDACTVTVQNSQGAPENGDAGKRISSMLLDELK
ncbi:MAG: outer membrane protein assembly factor BamC [Proteobacteria bacterium]|nr:outer membrane protein assembly factor BamC [Pseudomonadota bacterium]